MKSEAIKKLEKLDFEVKSKKTNMPIHCIPKKRYSDKTANGLTNCIINYLRLTGNQAERISNTGRPMDKRKVVSDVIGRSRAIGSIEWIPGQGTNGTSDISATIKGLSVKIEVKVGRDKQSQAQINYQQSIERSGGIYIVARSFEGFISDLNQLKLINTNYDNEKR